MSAAMPDWVVTIRDHTIRDHAKATCLIYRGKAKVFHAGFDDPGALAGKAAPEGEALNCYHRVRDEIEAAVETPRELLQKKG